MVEERVFSVPQGEVHYWVSRCGGPERPWLVFLPGLTADHRLFDRQIEGLSTKFSCLTWDPPAHGASRPFPLDFTLEDWALWLHGILEREGVSRPVLVGQSMGGYLAQVFLSRYPGQGAGFVSIDSCPLERSYYTAVELWLLRHTGGIFRSIPWPLLRYWGIRGTASTAYGRALMGEMMDSYSREEYCRLAVHGYRMLAWAAESGMVDRPGCPVLLLCGQRDAAGSSRRYNRAWARRTGYRVHWLTGAGHNANCDAWEEVNFLIERFAGSLSENREQ